MWKFIERLLFVQTKSGERKLGVGFYLLAALACIVPMILLFNSGGSPLIKKGKKTEPGLEPIQAPESKLTAETNMPNTLVAEMERELQILEEQSGILKPEEKKKRETEIRDKYQQQVQESRRGAARINFAERINAFWREPSPEPAPEPVTTTPPKEEQYMSFAERLAAEGKNAGGSRGGVVTFAPPTKLPTETEEKVGDIVSTNETPSQNPTTPKNLLPMGTFIPVVLEQDIISSDLQAHVWASVAADVTFRRQLQLPLGLVRIRGSTAREPVQNLLDIHFDVMVFSDGTELPISGNAYSAFDIRYPDRYRVRGVPGKLITPPMYTNLLNILLTAALGASDAYIENYLNKNTTTESTYTTIPQIDTITGKTTTVLQQSQGQPVNNKIGASIGLGAAQSVANELANQISKDLEKYRPYVKLEKGTPMFVQLDASVDVGKRRINGFAIDREERKKRGNEEKQVNRPPGDAQAEWQPTEQYGSSSVKIPGLTDMNIQERIKQAAEAANQQTETLGSNAKNELLQQLRQYKTTPSTQ